MIREVILTSQSIEGPVHLAPMGIHIQNNERLLMPFRPSTTLDNVLATGTAVMNHCDDVRLFAGCLTGRRDWPLLAADKIVGHRLAGALSHAELELVRHEDDPVRPKLYCRVIHEVMHAPFQGFNRAQFAVLEAAILVSRLHMLPSEKLESELAYLRIGFDKTAGPNEQEAWEWLMERIDAYRKTSS
jgi:hypothetical protein